MNYNADIKKLLRHFLPTDFVVTNWEGLKPFFQNLGERDLDSRESLEQWLKDASELEAVISEDACWRQIRMTCDTENKELEESFNFFMMKIQPEVQSWSDKLNKKLLACPFTKELDQKKIFYLPEKRKKEC